MRPARRLVGALAAVVTLGAGRGALAQEPAPMPAAPADVPAPRPTAPDTRTGHPTLGLQIGLQRLFGDAEATRSHGDVIGWGVTPALQLAYPFHRHVGVELWGSRGTFSGASGCSGCGGTSLAVGASVVFHLLDGSPLDPWMSVGAGYRHTKLELATGDLTYQGIEAFRLALGFDNYLSPAFGLGPSVELMLGRYGNRSPGTIGDGAAHGSISFGLRAVFSPF